MTHASIFQITLMISFPPSLFGKSISRVFCFYKDLLLRKTLRKQFSESLDMQYEIVLILFLLLVKVIDESIRIHIKHTEVYE